jgi:thiol-disulfide isomerase/thioredoxin
MRPVHLPGGAHRRLPPLLLSVCAVVLMAVAPTWGSSRGVSAAQEARTGNTGPVAPETDPGVFYYFFSYSCAYCRDAGRYVRELAGRYPDIEFRRLEVVMDHENQALLADISRRLQIKIPGVPLFVYGDAYVVGFKDQEVQKARIEAMIEGGGRPLPPAVAGIDPLELSRKLSLPLLTVVIGAVDGINPCSLYVLFFLLTLLLGAADRRRMLLLGGGFVVVSALVYFVFLTLWLEVFSLIAVRRSITLLFGAGVCVLGLLHLKEAVWFKRGPSLTIPERAKPSLFSRMRRIAVSPRLGVSVAGVAVTALLVSFLEFGCTVGLPTVFTRVLTLQGIPEAARFFYLLLYCAVYALPLLAVVILFSATLGRLRYSERMGRILKGVSGALMTVLGIVLVFDYRLLVFS